MRSFSSDSLNVVARQCGLRFLGPRLVSRGDGFIFYGSEKKAIQTPLQNLPAVVAAMPTIVQPVIVPVLNVMGFKGDHAISYYFNGLKFFFSYDPVQRSGHMEVSSIEKGTLLKKPLTVTERIKLGDAAIHLKPVNKEQRKTKDVLLEALDYRSLKATEKNYKELLAFLTGKRRAAFGSACDKLIERLIKEDPEGVIITTSDTSCLCCFKVHSGKLVVITLTEDGLSERSMNANERKHFLKAADELVASTQIQRSALQSLKKSLLEA